MKIENKKMKAMEELFRKIRNGGLKSSELVELCELSSYFLFIGVASKFTISEEKSEEKIKVSRKVHCKTCQFILCPKCGHDQFFWRITDNAKVCARCNYMPNHKSFK